MIHFDNDWQPLLAAEFQQEYYLKLRQFLKQQYATKQIYPPMNDIFNSLKATAYQDVKVVILGQDPYHGAGQAHGFAFSVQQGCQTPPSLQNIYKELKQDLGCFIPNNGCLLPWTRQGVLLMNTVLTVEAGRPNSHANQGWEIFTNRVIELLNQREQPIIFLLWGRNAQQKSTLITNPHHYILQAPHPSPLSASRGFFGCQHFSQCNKLLSQKGCTPIDWQIANI